MQKHRAASFRRKERQLAHWTSADHASDGLHESLLRPHSPDRGSEGGLYIRAQKPSAGTLRYLHDRSPTKSNRSHASTRLPSIMGSDDECDAEGGNAGMQKEAAFMHSRLAAPASSMQNAMSLPTMGHGEFMRQARDASLSHLLAMADGSSKEAPNLPPPGDGAANPNPNCNNHNHHPKDPPDEEPRQGDLAALWDMVTSSYINLLLITVPLGIASGMLHWGAIPTFSLNFIALVPLALILGDITEDLALRFGDVVGGLLNATFGNVVEVILSLSALQRGLFTVVSTSLLGSILSNLLLVLGCCMLFGGCFFKTQHFNEIGNRTCSALLFLSCIGIILPTGAAHMIHAEDDAHILAISRGTSVILLLCYVAYLVFQLHTHRQMFSPGEEDEEQPALSLPTALIALTAITVMVAVLSEFLTGSIEEVSEKTNLGEAFLGMIVLPIAGNACEHLTAITVAMKNKMDLSLGVAVGSSIQIALFAIPLAVVVAWVQDIPFGLNFDTFSATVLTLSVVHANNITNDAMSHWLLGVQLVAVYIIIALAYLFRP